jgi:murein DD-endopeptidase MepM/ murein hydrolase activator NlpD
MRFLRHAPGRRVILGVAIGVGAGALGAGLLAADLFRDADHRSTREIAALQAEVRSRDAETARDRAALDALRVELARTTAERDRTASAKALEMRAAADLRHRLQQLAGERDAAVAYAHDEHLRLRAERDAAVAHADDERVQILAERDAALERAMAEEARLAGEVEATLERTAQEVRESRRERDRAVAERDAVMADTRTVLGDLDAETRKTVADVERIIFATGLAANRLAPEPNRLRRVGARGGPYIPWKEQVALADHAQQAQAQAMTQQLDRLKGLRDVMVRLPLIAPVTHAILSDGFGYRWDPINGRGARHDGLDLRAVRDGAIHAPSAGTVILAGWDGAYGYTIEIDHGFGVTTRYSHLSRMLVRKGDVVAPREHIGVVGATGRATGTHLHYEIRLDDKPLNPMLFLGAVHAGEAFSGFVAR